MIGNSLAANWMLSTLMRLARELKNITKRKKNEQMFFINMHDLIPVENAI